VLRKTIQQRDDGTVLVSGAAVALLYRAVLALAIRHPLDGVSSPALLHTLRAMLYRAATSRPRHELATAVGASACCTCQHGELIGSAAAAGLLAMSRRQTQRLAATDDGSLLGAVRCGSVWLYQRNAVLTLAAQRKAAAG